jgi:hypothetical protein
VNGEDLTGTRERVEPVDEGGLGAGGDVAEGQRVVPVPGGELLFGGEPVEVAVELRLYAARPCPSRDSLPSYGSCRPDHLEGVDPYRLNEVNGRRRPV